MINDFNRLKSDEYELFLPTPMFSDLIIERTLKADFLYKDVIKIECDQNFFTHVERTGAFLHVEETHYEGSAFLVPYRIDTGHYDPGMTLDGAIIFTYLGGETVVKVRVTIETEVVMPSSEVEQMDEPEKTMVVTPVKAYSVQTSKKAFNIKEKASVVVINHECYPIVVKVQGIHKGLVLQEDMITVQDIGILKASLKQSWADRFITRKYYKTPSVKEVLRLTIRHEGGKDVVEVPLTYTSYTVPVDSKEITDERTYRRCALGARQRYNSFLIHNKTSDLEKARQLVEDCMAYHTTLVDLRLFYILILLEQRKYKKVRGQISELLKFSNYYLEDHFDEFIEILTILADWLAGKNISEKIHHWPMSYYRQIFRLRILEDQVQSLKDYERLFLNGFKSTHFFAHVAGEMLKKPALPVGPSKFYHALVTWAISKDVLQGQWLDYLDKYHHQVMRQKVINSYDASQLYANKSSEGFLSIFVAAAIEERQCTARNHAIYLEAIQRRLLMPNLQMSYVKSACKNRLPIMFESLQLSEIYSELTRQEKAYLLTQYLEDPMTEKGPHQTMMRIYKQFIEEHSEEVLSKDEKALVAYDLSEKISRYQWSDIKEGYGITRVRQLVGEHKGLLKTLMTEGVESLGYEWFVERLTATELLNLVDCEASISFIDWLLEAKREDAFSAFGRQGYLAMYSEAQQLTWCHRMLEMNHPYTGELAIRLYQGGSQSPELIGLMMQTMVGSIEEEIALYNKAEIEGQYSEDFVESLLYKGVLTRLCPDQIRRIYLKYRSAKKQPIVCRHMDHYFAARVLIEEPYGYESLIEVFEEDLPMEVTSKEGQTMNPVGLALMRLYQFYGDGKSVISGNLIKNAVKNGIIFPWFSDLAKPYMKTGALRKAAFFSYNSQPWIDVMLYYRSDDQSSYRSMSMKHVFFGLYIGYVVAFYQDRIQYYYEETLKDGSKRITESGIYHHQAVVSPLDEPNDYDVINTIMMGFEMKDEDSVDETLADHIRLREYKKDAFELT